MLGLPGSGKSTFSNDLQSKLGIIRFAVDEEYSKLGGNLKDSYWDIDIATKAGDHIKQETIQLVANGQSVILDLCPWVKEKRDEYRNFIESINAECHIYYFDIRKQELLRRLSIRNKSGQDYYIISPEMLDDFIEEFDVPINEQVDLVES